MWVGPVERRRGERGEERGEEERRRGEAEFKGSRQRLKK